MIGLRCISGVVSDSELVATDPGFPRKKLGDFTVSITSISLSISVSTRRKMAVIQHSNAQATEKMLVCGPDRNARSLLSTNERFRRERLSVSPAWAFIFSHCLNTVYMCERILPSPRLKPEPLTRYRYTRYLPTPSQPVIDLLPPDPHAHLTRSP
jgi:hypothetical protein